MDENSEPSDLDEEFTGIDKTNQCKRYEKCVDDRKERVQNNVSNTCDMFICQMYADLTFVYALRNSSSPFWKA